MRASPFPPRRRVDLREEEHSCRRTYLVIAFDVSPLPGDGADALNHRVSFLFVAPRSLNQLSMHSFSDGLSDADGLTWHVLTRIEFCVALLTIPPGPPTETGPLLDPGSTTLAAPALGAAPGVDACLPLAMADEDPDGWTTRGRAVENAFDEDAEGPEGSLIRIGATATRWSALLRSGEGCVNDERNRRRACLSLLSSTLCLRSRKVHQYRTFSELLLPLLSPQRSRVPLPTIFVSSLAAARLSDSRAPSPGPSRLRSPARCLRCSLRPRRISSIPCRIRRLRTTMELQSRNCSEMAVQEQPCS